MLAAAGAGMQQKVKDALETVQSAVVEQQQQQKQKQAAAGIPQ